MPLYRVYEWVSNTLKPVDASAIFLDYGDVPEDHPTHPFLNYLNAVCFRLERQLGLEEGDHSMLDEHFLCVQTEGREFWLIDEDHITGAQQRVRGSKERVLVDAYGWPYDYEVERVLKPWMLDFFNNMEIRASVRVDHVYPMREVSGVMWHAVITPLQKLSPDNIHKLHGFMRQMCTNELQPLQLGDFVITVGDGDDSGACWIDGSNIYVWVRSWK